MKKIFVMSPRVIAYLIQHGYPAKGYRKGKGAYFADSVEVRDAIDWQAILQNFNLNELDDGRNK